jgi:hypothetical protein
MKDKAALETIVDTSGLDWIIVRLPFFNDDPGTGNIHVFSAETRSPPSCPSTTVLNLLRRIPIGRCIGADGICFTAGVLCSSR